MKTIPRHKQILMQRSDQACLRGSQTETSPTQDLLKTTEVKILPAITSMLDENGLVEYRELCKADSINEWMKKREKRME